MYMNNKNGRRCGAGVSPPDPVPRRVPRLWGMGDRDIDYPILLYKSPPPSPAGSVGSVQAGGGGWLPNSTLLLFGPFFMPPPLSLPMSNLMDFRWQYPKAEKRALILNMYILPPPIMKQMAAQYEWYISTLLNVQVAVGLCRPSRLLNLWSLEHIFITIGWSTSGTFLHISIVLDRTILSRFFFFWEGGGGVDITTVPPAWRRLLSPVVNAQVVLCTCCTIRGCPRQQNQVDCAQVWLEVRHVWNNLPVQASHLINQVRQGLYPIYTLGLIGYLRSVTCHADPLGSRRLSFQLQPSTVTKGIPVDGNGQA